MIKNYIIAIVCIVSFNSFAQQTKSSTSFSDRVRFGGGVGVNFNNVGYNASVSPTAYYEVSPKFSAGLGAIVILSKSADVKFNAIGGSLSGLYNPIPSLQLSSEFEYLRVTETTPVSKYKSWVPALFVGAGYRINNIIVGIRYDVLYDENKSIYLDPWAPFVRLYF